MKKLIIFIAVYFSFLSVSYSEISNTYTGLKFLFHFNENAGSMSKDEVTLSTGNLNAMTWSSTGCANGTPALYCNGGQAFQEVPCPSVPTGNDPWSVVFLYNKLTTGEPQICTSYGRGSNNKWLSIGWANGANVAYIWRYDNDWTTGYTTDNNNWHFMAVTYDGTTETQYIDGSATSYSHTPSAFNITSAEPLSIGNDNGSDAPFYGFIDEVADFNICLSTTQVDELKNQALASPTPYPPGPPAVVRDGTGADISSTSATAQLSANWDASTNTVTGYTFAIGTTQGGTQTVAWSTLGNVTSTTTYGLSLTIGTTYYFGVKAFNGVGDSSETDSNGQFVYTSPPSPPPPLTPVVGSKAKTIIMQ